MKFVAITLFWYTISTFILIFTVSYLSGPTLSSSEDKSSLRNSVAAINLSDSKKENTRAVVISQPDTDVRILALNKFLNDYNSPLVDNVEELVKQADLWGIDYALIPAIAMQESQGCKKSPETSNNCWGFGIYGKKITRFNSYNQAIAQIAKTIKETYIKKGLTNVTLLEDRWAPQSRGQWSSAVNFFIGKIRIYEKNIINI